MNTGLITYASSIRTSVRARFSFRFAMIFLFLFTMAPAGHAQLSGTAPGNAQLSCRQIAVIGAVRTPSRLDAPLRMHLLEVLVSAGGPNGQAGTTVRIIHTCHCSACDKIGMKAGDTDEYILAAVLYGRENGNPYVAPGDIVLVPEAPSVFVIRGVNVGRRVRFSEGMTVTRAIAMAGVAVGSSKLVTARIYRNSSQGTRQDPIIVRLKAVLDGRGENVLLQPLDIVEVSDELGHFLAPRLSPPKWDPRLPKWNPPHHRKETSGSTLITRRVLAGPCLIRLDCRLWIQ